MIRIEYRYPWGPGGWNCFGSAATLNVALELLDVCRMDNPGSECRVRNEQDARLTEAQVVRDASKNSAALSA